MEVYKVYSVYYSHPISHRHGLDVKRDQEDMERLVAKYTPDGFRINILFPGRGEDLLNIKDIPLPPSEESETGFISGRRVTRLEIIQRNYDDIDAADFVFCDFMGALDGSTTFIPGKVLGPEHRSDGCLSEISYARAKGKRGILAMEPQGNINDRFFQSRILNYREHTREGAVRKMMMLLLPVSPRIPTGIESKSPMGFQ